MRPLAVVSATLALAVAGAAAAAEPATAASATAATPAPAEAAAQPAGPHPFLAQKAKALITADGKKADPARLTGRKHVLVYFSAHWCPPCRKFTPELVAYYQKNGGGNAFEIVFVSSDEDGPSMLKYMQEAAMPWVALRWGASTRPAIAKAYAGNGIPCLVLLDEQDQVVSHSYVDGKYVGPHKVLADLTKLLAAK